MAEGRSFQAKIELMGKLHGSLSGAVKMAQGKLNQLANTARKMSAAIGRGFAKVGSVLKSFAGQVIGLTLAFAGLRSAGEFIAKAKEQFRGNELAAAELNATLANNPAILKLGTKELERQQKGFSDLADRMQESSTYASSVWRSAFTGLSQWGAGVKDAEQLSGFFNDILAGRHGLKATAENAKSLGDAFGKMIKTGKVGRLGKEFGLDTKEFEKQLAKRKTATDKITYAMERMRKYQGRAAVVGATEAGKIQKAENEIADFQSRMGEGFLKVEGKWIQFVARMAPRLEPAIKKVTQLFEDAIVGVTGWMDDFLADEEVIESWNELAEAAGDIWNAVSDIIGLGEVDFGKWLKAEFINQIRMLKEDLELILKAIKRINDLWKKFTAPLPAETQKRMELMTAPVGGVSMGTRAAEQAQAEAVAAGQIEAPRRRLVGQAAHRAAQAEAIAARAAQQEVAAIGESAGQASEKVAAIEEPTAKVEEAAKEAGKAFQGWDIGGAIKGGLGWISGKLGEITQKAGQANAALSSGGAPAAPATPMQHGGIVRSSTFANIGEAGPEAVIPLSGGRRSTDLLGAAAAALGVHGGSRFNVSYAPNFTVNGAGPEAARAIERIVRAGHDELLGQIEALDSEMMRRAFV